MMVLLRSEIPCCRQPQRSTHSTCGMRPTRYRVMRPASDSNTMRRESWGAPGFTVRYCPPRTYLCGVLVTRPAYAALTFDAESPTATPSAVATPALSTSIRATTPFASIASTPAGADAGCTYAHSADALGGGVSAPAAFF